MIYKLLRPNELSDFIMSQRFEGSSDDQRDGFIHLSSDDQLSDTIDKHFSRESYIFALNCGGLEGDVKLVWEPSRGGKLFPHLYRPLLIADVSTILPLHEKKWPPKQP